MNPTNTAHLYSPELIEAIVVAAVAQIGYNPDKRADYPRGVFATSIERRRDIYMPLDPKEIFRFQPIACWLFDWWNPDGTTRHIGIIDRGDRKLLQDNSQGREIAEIEVEEAGAFSVRDKVYNQQYRGSAFTWAYPLSVEIFRTPDPGDSCFYKIGVTS